MARADNKGMEGVQAADVGVASDDVSWGRAARAAGGQQPMAWALAEVTIRGEDAVEAQQVDPWWRGDAGQPPKEVDRATHEVASPVGQQLQSLLGDGAPSRIETQSLQRLPVVGVEVLAGVQ